MVSINQNIRKFVFGLLIIGGLTLGSALAVPWGETEFSQADLGTGTLVAGPIDGGE